MDQHRDLTAADRPDPGGRPSLAAGIYADLRSDILRCRIRPGADLSEAELATRFGVSKTPVREALGSLRQDGLVTTFPRRGYQVTPITLSGMNELFDVRTMLEAGAAEMACERISAAEVAELRKLLVAHYDLVEDASVDRFIEVNRAFHLAIARISGNARLFRLLERQILELERFFYIGAQARDVNAETAVEHAEIVDALAERDSARVRTLMIRHNAATRDGLVRILATARGAGSHAI